jgi:FkbM family methyltransferase
MYDNAPLKQRPGPEVVVNLHPAKQLALRVGLYRHARWLERHVLRPASLKTLQADREFLRPLVPAGAKCFDIGANNGSKAEVLLDLGAQVLAVEPQATALAELTAQLGARSGLTILCVALADKPGVATLHLAPSATAASLVSGWGGADVGSVDVPVLTLDLLIEKYGAPHYCKIDVEGSDVAVLRGLSRPLPLISFEYHLWADGAADLRAAMARIAELGRYEFNYTRQDVPGFQGTHWGTADDVYAWLGLTKPTPPPSDYGDVFARLLTA